MSSALLRTDGHYRLYNKGAAEWVLKRCTHACDTDGKVQPLAPGQADELVGVITGMASRGLRCICLAYTDYEMDDASRYWLVCVHGWAGAGRKGSVFWEQDCVDDARMCWVAGPGMGGMPTCSLLCSLLARGCVEVHGKEGAGSGPRCTMWLQASCTACWTQHGNESGTEAVNLIPSPGLPCPSGLRTSLMTLTTPTATSSSSPLLASRTL